MCPYSELFWSVFFRIWTEYEKIRIRKTPNTETFYAVVFTGQSKFLFSLISILSTITSQFLWFNKNIKIAKNVSIYFEEFPIKRLKFVENLFKSSNKIEPWFKIKEDLHLLESKNFQLMQLLHALGTSWKQSVKEKTANQITLSIYDYHLIKTIKLLLHRVT